MAQIGVISTTIPANETKSGAVDLGAHALVAIEMPEAFNGTTITFEAKAKRTEDPDKTGGVAGEDWDPVIDSAGAAITWTVAAARIVVPTAAHAAAMAPLRHIRLVSGTAQNPAREFRLICKEA